MSDLSLITADTSGVDTFDEIVQRKWDRFVAGDEVSLSGPIYLPSRIAKIDLANWANESFSVVGPTKFDSTVIAEPDRLTRARTIPEHVVPKHPHGGLRMRVIRTTMRRWATAVNYMDRGGIS